MSQTEVGQGTITEEAADPGGYVRLPSQADKEAGQAYLRSLLPAPAAIPPMANIALLRELILQDGGTRAVTISGTAYPVPPLTYLHGLDLTRCLQDLQRLLSGDQVLDRLPALRDTYRSLATLFRAVTRHPRGRAWQPEEDPFEDLTAGEFSATAAILIEAGNECPIPPAVPTPDAKYRPYDAMDFLLTYLLTVGHLPGWTVPPGLPASWRHYCFVRDYLTRRTATAQIEHFMAYVMPQVTDADVRKSYLEDLHRRTGQTVEVG